MEARSDTQSGFSAVAPAGPAAVRTSEWLLLLAAGLGLVTPNPLLTAGCFASLALILRLTLRPGEPPVMASVMGLLWIQSAIQVLSADLSGVPLWEMSAARGIEQAVALSLLWNVMISIGVRIALARLPLIGEVRREDASSQVIVRLFAAYWIYYVATIVLALVPYGGMRQVVRSAMLLRYAIVFALFLLAVRGAPHARYAWGIFVFELLSGFLGFFSAFKTPLLLLLMALLGQTRRFTLVQIAGAVAVAACTVGLAIVWTAIKPDYRDALNQGTGAQVVRIDREERVSTLAELVSKLDGPALKNAADQLVIRIGYVQYFAFVMDYVPRFRDHEDGRLWGAAIRHVFYPRLFFPDKPALESDTVVTARYTGLELGNQSRDTSISIGTPGESYIDFGEVFMFVPALLIGLMYGFGCRWLLGMSRHPALAFGLTAAVFLPQGTLELTTAKLLGGHIMLLGLAVLLWKLLGDRLEAWVYGDARRQGL